MNCAGCYLRGSSPPATIPNNLTIVSQKAHKYDRLLRVPESLIFRLLRRVNSLVAD
jgi:hypothetical protein